MKFLSFLLRTVAIVFILLGIVFLRAATTTASRNDPDSVLLVPLGLIISGAGGWVYNFSRKLVSKTWAQVSAKDPRPPILLLRSFTSDPAGQRTSVSRWWQPLIYLGSALPGNQRTEEEQLQFAFADIGPMVTAAQPGTRLHPPGVARIVIPSIEWKPRVLQLIREACLVVIRPEGDTPGLVWEIQQIFAAKHHTRIIFLLPASKKEYESFCQMIGPVLGKDLPAFKKQGSVGHFSGLLYFSANRTPMIQGIKTSIYSPTPQAFNHIAVGMKKLLQEAGYFSLATKPAVLAARRVRLLTSLYDVLICVILSMLISGMISLFYHQSFYQELTRTGLISLIALFFLYPLVWEICSPKGSFGKRMLNVYLADKEHIKPTSQQILFRNIFRLFSFPFFFITIPYTIFAWYKGRPLFHDHLSRTRFFQRQ